MKDRINNVLAAGDKVLVELPVSSIIGFVAKLEEPGLVGRLAGSVTPGRIFVSCVIALPVDGELNAAPQLVKVYDSDKTAIQDVAAALERSSGPN